MLNNINTQIPNSDNTIAARKISSSDKRRTIVLEAPQYIPKYSITKKMEEQDAFRRSVLQDSFQREENKNSRKKFFKVLALAIGTVVGIILCKKS